MRKYLSNNNGRKTCNFRLRNPVVFDSSGPIGLRENALGCHNSPQWSFRLAVAAFPGAASAAAKAQTVIIFPGGSIDAAGHITNTGRPASWWVDPFEPKSMWVDILMKKYLLLALMVLGILIPASAQTIFNCTSGFVTANTTCGVGYNGTGGYEFQFAQDPNGVISGTAANLIPGRRRWRRSVRVWAHLSNPS